MPESKTPVVKVTMEQYLLVALSHAHAFLHDCGDAVPDERMAIICEAFHTAKNLVQHPNLDGVQEFKMEIIGQHSQALSMN